MNHCASSHRAAARRHIVPSTVRGFFACGAAIVLALLPTLADAGTLSQEKKSIPGLNPQAPLVEHTLRLTGMIELKDADELQSALSKIKAKRIAGAKGPMATLELSSAGGDLLAGIRIGYVLREFDVATIVRKGDRCLSACALAFLGGTARHIPLLSVPSRTIEVGAQVSFHNFKLDVAAVEKDAPDDPSGGIARSFALARTGDSQLIKFAVDMGVDASFVAALVGRPSDSWLPVDTVQSFLQISACPSGEQMPPGRLAQQAVNICNHAMGWISPAKPWDARQSTPAETKRHLLEHIHANILSYNIKGPLADQLAAVIASKDQRLVDGVYADLRGAGVAVPETSGAHFDVDGPTNTDFNVHCHVVLSQSDPDQFDLVLVTPTSLLRALRPPPAACPRLYRYERDDVVNPQRR